VIHERERVKVRVGEVECDLVFCVERVTGIEPA
jgi:hypothetical protein